MIALQHTQPGGGSVMQRNGKWAGTVFALLVASCSAPPTKTPAASVVPAAQLQAVNATGAAAGGAGAAVVNARLVRQGYQVMRRGGQLVYCRTESVTGTMLSKTTCLTELEVKQQAETAQQSRDALHQPLTPKCLGAVCAGKDGGG
jgi:hypothetical protein